MKGGCGKDSWKAREVAGRCQHCPVLAASCSSSASWSRAPVLTRILLGTPTTQLMPCPP